jgi:hypothetical protein
MSSTAATKAGNPEADFSVSGLGNPQVELG